MDATARPDASDDAAPDAAHPADPVRILLVEDDPDFAFLVAQHLQHSSGLAHELQTMPKLSAALEVLVTDTFDVIIMDLGLPDSSGLEGLDRVRTLTQTPVVIITAGADSSMGTQAIKRGAQDYVPKDKIDADRLERAIRYALERTELLNQLREAREREAREFELGRLGDLGGGGQRGSVTAEMFGTGPLRTARNETFILFCQRYAAALTDALDERAYKTDKNVSEHLRQIAFELGRLGAGPRDVVDIHRRVVRLAAEHADSAERAQAMVDEGRLRALELMGYLASYYRTATRRGPRSITPNTGSEPSRTEGTSA